MRGFKRRRLGELRREAPETVFVEETVTSCTTLFRQVPTRECGTWIKSGASGLGWGLGAAVGAKLAHPDRPVVAPVGDGAFFFGTPFAAFGAARAAGAPILAVVLNNGGFNATRQPTAATYPDGASARSGQFVAVDFDPAPRYDLLAPAVGARGERVEEPAEVLPALRRGLEWVRAGQSAIVDVILARP